MHKVDSEPPAYKPRRFHWYIRPKGQSESEKDCECGASTSKEDCRDSNCSEDTSEYRFCSGTVSAKYLSNMILIAMIQEITCGFIFATRDLHWYQQPQMVILAICRMFQIIPCFVALLGNYRNNAMMVIPFMISQVLVGAYADIQSYMILLQDWRLSKTASTSFLLSTPLLYLVLPLFAYVLVLLTVLYIQYKSIQFVNHKKHSLTRHSCEETLHESLM